LIAALLLFTFRLLTSGGGHGYARRVVLNMQRFDERLRRE